MRLFERKHTFQFCVSSSRVGGLGICVCVRSSARVCTYVCTWVRVLSSLILNVEVITAVLLIRISSSSMAKMGAGNLQRSQERASFVLSLSLTVTFFGFLDQIPWM